MRIYLRVRHELFIHRETGIYTLLILYSKFAGNTIKGLRFFVLQDIPT